MNGNGGEEWVLGSLGLDEDEVLKLVGISGSVWCWVAGMELCVWWVVGEEISEVQGQGLCYGDGRWRMKRKNEDKKMDMAKPWSNNMTYLNHDPNRWNAANPTHNCNKYTTYLTYLNHDPNRWNAANPTHKTITSCSSIQ